MSFKLDMFHNTTDEYKDDWTREQHKFRELDFQRPSGNVFRR